MKGICMMESSRTRFLQLGTKYAIVLTSAMPMPNMEPSNKAGKTSSKEYLSLNKLPNTMQKQWQYLQ